MVSLTLLVCGPAAGAPPALIGSGPPGGEVRLIARSPTNPAVVFAAADTVWKSTDGGAHWAPYGKRMVRMFVSGMVIGPGPVDDVLIVGNGSIVRSTAGGDWQQTTDPATQPVDHLAQAPTHPARMVTSIRISGATACPAVITRRTENAGRTWFPPVEAPMPCTPLAQGIDDPVIIASPTDPNSFWIGTTGILFLWHSADGGRTWQQQPTPDVFAVDRLRLSIPPPYDQLVATSGLNDDVFHQPLSGGVFMAGFPGSCPAIQPEAFVLARHLLGCGTSVGPVANDLTAAAGGMSALAAGSPGILRQAASTWLPSVAGMDAQLVLGAARLGDGSLVLAASTGMYRRIPGGAWTPWSDGLVGFDPLPGGGLDPAPGAGFGPGVLTADGRGGVLVVSGGRIWRRGAVDAAWSPVPLPSPDVTQLSRIATRSHPLYAVDTRRIFASDDGGATWPRVRALANPQVFDPPASAPARAFATSFDAVKGRTRLWRTDDRGATWHPLPSPAGGFCLIYRLEADPRDPDHLVALATVLVPFQVSDTSGNLGTQKEFQTTVIISHDGGRSWTHLVGRVVPEVTQFAFDRDAAGVIYAGSFWDGLWASADDGLTWGRVPGAAPNQAVTSFLPETIPVVTAAGRAAVAWRLFATLARVRSGITRVDARVRRPSVRGRPRLHGRRTGRVATCTGGRAVGAPTEVLWLASRRQIGHGRRIRLPGSSVGRPVHCEVHAVTPYAIVFHRSRTVSPIGRPFAERPRIGGQTRVGTRVTCRATWYGSPASIAYTWRVSGKVRARERTYVVGAADAFRPLTCSTSARNRYGTFMPRTSPAIRVRR